MTSSTTTSIETTCCVVGAGPAGVMVSYLLAQRGIEVLLLESHHDFDRDFRGDTIHGGIMESLDDMGLADALLQLPHAKMHSLGLTMDGVTQTLVDFRLLKSKYPFVTMMPQSRFLEFMVERARSFATFQLQLGASAKELVEEAGRYLLHFNSDDGRHIVSADLIIACDGRHSRMRRSLDLTPVKSAVPMDVIWFRVPSLPGDGITAGGHVGSGHMLIILEREAEWQIGFVFTHGEFSEIKSEGIDWLKEQTTETLPLLKNLLSAIQSWKDVSVLKVESSRLKKWYTKNVLLIGDAAHVMSPVGGVGINYAIQDAIVTAGIVAEPLLAKGLTEQDLAKVQRKRKWPTRFIQAFQAQMQKRIVAQGLGESTSIRLPWILRFRFVRRLIAKLISHGLFKVEVPKANRQQGDGDQPSGQRSL